MGKKSKKTIRDLNGMFQEVGGLGKIVPGISAMSIWAVTQEVGKSDKNLAAEIM